MRPLQYLPTADYCLLVLACTDLHVVAPSMPLPTACCPAVRPARLRPVCLRDTEGPQRSSERLPLSQRGPACMPVVLIWRAMQRACLTSSEAGWRGAACQLHSFTAVGPGDSSPALPASEASSSCGRWCTPLASPGFPASTAAPTLPPSRPTGGGHCPRQRGPDRLFGEERHSECAAELSQQCWAEALLRTPPPAPACCRQLLASGAG